MLRRTPLHISIPIKIVLEKREKSETVQRKCMFLALSIYSMPSGVLIVLWKLWKENDDPGNSCHRKQQKSKSVVARKSTNSEGKGRHILPFLFYSK